MKKDCLAWEIKGYGAACAGTVMIDLQLFADNDEKTEKATPKKRQEARKKGQVFQSREISSATVLVFLFVGLKVFGGYIYKELLNFINHLLTEYPFVDNLFSVQVLSKLFAETLTVFARIIVPILTIAVAAGFAMGAAQVGFLFTSETLGFKLDRLNPAIGLKRIFSMKSLVELLKAAVKIAIVAYMAYGFIRGEETGILNTINMDVIAAASYIAGISINLAVRLCIALIVLGILDYGYQWWEYEKSLRMTKQELKEEFKQTEGNPEVKSRIKQKQRQLSLRRMMHEIPKADVVITNPTHFAVALKYDPKVSDAPVVVAKGQDYIALRIKEIARENNVEIVENRQLARTIYYTVDIGQAIPPELYQAVAEVLAFVYSLRERAGIRHGAFSERG